MKKYSHLQKFIFAIIVLSIFACSKDSTKKIKQEAKFIGKETCKSCHEEEYNSWVGSDHDKAMAVATDSSVLGNFNKSEFKFEGVTSKFYKKGNKFFVRTNGPHGKIGEFEITHTFGYKPLQQYLIPFENGRYQCLPIAWDTEKEKWFSLAEAIYSDDIPKPNDWLYWTNNAQNWNGMCAECHSTNLQKNFDPKTKIFNTTYSEINVSCEACHGPGSNHKEWAESPKMIRTTDSNFDLIVKTSNISSKKYVELCTYCHSRRASLSHLDYKSKHSLDMIIPGALDENYFPDGQILEEDYVYASFAHSKMYENDVSCRNCHNVHSGKLILEGNTLCAQCHVPNVYDTPKHHFHKLQLEKGKPLILKDKIYQVGEGAKCINCHMPGRYYMGNDFRRDH
ncbi:MAG: multiheme c-type cytochrome, partial [Melioribacteraceae bacterium]